MNKLDKDYQALLQDILDNGVTKSDRTGTGTLSVFGRQIRHKMSDGFPLLTTKKMAFKSICTELLWFLRGDTSIEYLLKNDCNIWTGDVYKKYEKWWKSYSPGGAPIPLSREMFIDRIKTDDEFAKKWGDLGPIYGKQWRSWRKNRWDKVDMDSHIEYVDQIANLINDLKTNPDSRRLLVSAWNPAELDQMVLLPCHYGFQVYTRELSIEERIQWWNKGVEAGNYRSLIYTKEELDENNVPTRTISLMWNQRSVDTFLGLPFNIASYGLLLEIIAKAVNMVPDELIGNLGDTHLYLNHVEQAKEQIGRELTHEERCNLLKDAMSHRIYNKTVNELMPFGGGMSEYYESHNIPQRTRESYPLPTLNINTEFWSYESGECGVGPLDAVKVFESFKDDNFCRCLLEEDIQLSNYQSHPTIKAPLSN
jgi:thymidylate synthase